MGGDDGVSSLTSLFSKKSFRRILLANNEITDKGAEALANALNGTTVEEIDLSGNKISGKGASALKKLMESTDSLHTLNLASNSVVADESSSFISSIKFKDCSINT